MAGRLAGKVAIITGAAQGIGYGIAALFAREGARLLLGDLQPEAGAAAAERIVAAGGSAAFYELDVRDETACAGLVERCVAEYGRLDVLVNNAGIYPRATLAETSAALWDEIHAVTLRGAFFCCKHAQPALRASGGGSIINIGSIHGIQGAETLVAYASAKGGLLALTRTLAGALAPERIRVNYLIPGWVLSEGEIALHAAQGVSEAELRRSGARLRLGRHQTPEDAAYAAVYLAADESSQVTGTVLNVDAGAATLPLTTRDPAAQ